MEASITKKLYKAVVDKDWVAFNKDLGQLSNIEELLRPISTHGDNIIHLAVYSGSKEPLDHILSYVYPVDQVESFIGISVNAYRNTVLHEAAISGNLEAARLLIDQYKLHYLLETVNDSGETPLFRAAAFGNTRIVKFLASQPGQMVTSDGKKQQQLKDIHRQNKQGASVLFAAVQGQHFGTALELLSLDEELAELGDKSGTCLYMLAKIPSALKSDNQLGKWKKLLFFYLPACDHTDDTYHNIEIESQDIESGHLHKGLYYKINQKIWKSIFRVSSVAKNIWEEKRNHDLASKLTRILTEKDKSWEQNILQYVFNGSNSKKKEDKEEPGNPLFAAIRTGNVELVKLILKEYPQQLEQLNNKKQNILHVAAMYRQKEIFDFVTSKEIPRIRLARQIDVNGYTILHSVADTEHYKGGTTSGPAYQLQEELDWFHSVKEIIPSYYTMLLARNKMTAEEILKEKHAEQLKKAQSWIKETSQSCSGVAVLVATVVFAAAFTVPGGTNENNGLPVLLHSPFFLFFTIMDVISLSCSLTSVVMFLSVVTSPFELENFHVSLPRRLTLGFALLFMSVATTMLAFTSTIFLIIRLDQRQQWKMTLICSAAFFPVSVLALTHFPLFVSFINAGKNLLAFPCRSVIRCLKKLR